MALRRGHALLALLSTSAIYSCATPDYQTPIPFTCSGNAQCPAGYRCSSEYCIQNDAADLPPLLQRSTAAFVPTVRPDPDRGGTMACWTRQEETDSPNGAVYGAFMAPDGTVSETIPLAMFDTRGSDVLMDCAPIPNTGGKVLVAAWLQSQGVGQIQLSVWSPDQPNGTTGTTHPFYDEVSPDPSLIVPAAMELTIVGNRVWVPFQQPRPSTLVSQPTHRIVRLMVGANELAAGAPTRDVVVPQTGPSENLLSRFYAGDRDGAWLIFSALFMAFGFVNETATTTTIRGAMPTAEPGNSPEFAAASFSLPIASLTVPGDGDAGVDGGTGDAQKLAMLWYDPNSPATIGTLYRIAWATDSTATLTIGPVLPFSRLDTTWAAGMQVNGDLYVFGTPVGPPIPTMPLDAGTTDSGASVDASSDGSMDATLGPGQTAPQSGGPLTMYKIPWGAPDYAPVTPYRVLPRALGNAEVPAASVHMMPDGQHFALAWVEFYPADSVGHGARYALYFQRFDF